MKGEKEIKREGGKRLNLVLLCAMFLPWHQKGLGLLGYHVPHACLQGQDHPNRGGRREEVS